MFDVDWMAGMSVGLFTLQNADVKTVGPELDKAVGDKATSPLAGILRIIPIERLNALLVITPQPAYLDEAKKWIARLDQAGSGDGPRFYVYNLQNQRAEKLGPLLTQAFTGRAPPAAAPPAPTVAPGTPAGTIVNPPSFQAQPTVVQPTINVTTTPAPGTQAAATAATGTRRRGPRHRAQHPGRRRQGQQHAADRRHGARVSRDRSGAEEARRPVAAGADRRDDGGGHADRRAPVRRRMAVQGRGAVRSRRGRPLHAERAHQPGGRGSRRRSDQRGARARAGLRLHHQQRELPGRHPGGAAPARHLRQHEGAREPAPRRARQPEGDDQGGRPDPDLPAERRRQHDQRRDHDVAVHRHGRAAAGDAAHQSAAGSSRSTCRRR